jgi:type IV secretion system protein VirB8
MFRKKDTTPKVEGAVAKAVNYEVTIADIARRSERRAWMVAFAAMAMSLILAGGYFYMLPLKEKVPFLVMADAYTGTATVAQLKENFTNRSITASEAINRSNVAHFILARESYDSSLIGVRDWKTVYTMSSPDVAAGYTALHARTNPNRPFAVYGKSRAIRIKILSITLLGAEAGAPPKSATVRFQRSIYDKKTAGSQPLDSKIATLEFTYKSNLQMDEEDRIENPLGFQVTNYRVDNDYAASPPLEIQVPQMPAVQPGQVSDAATPATLQPDTAPPDGQAPPLPEGADGMTSPPSPTAQPPVSGSTNQANGVSTR